jgi:hypothetical protein
MIGCIIWNQITGILKREYIKVLQSPNLREDQDTALTELMMCHPPCPLFFLSFCGDSGV